MLKVLEIKIQFRRNAEMGEKMHLVIDAYHSVREGKKDCYMSVLKSV